MTTYVLSRCHCGMNVFNIPFETAKLPIAASACHCNSCRHTTGQMFSHYVPFRGAPLYPSFSGGSEESASLEGLTKYQTSDAATRYFCSKCAAHMFLSRRERETPVFSVSSGSLDKVVGVATIGQHVHVEDTLDGGLAELYRTENGVVPSRFSGRVDTEALPIGWKSQAISTKPPQQSTDMLPFHCHCKSVSLLLQRSLKVPSPKPEKWLIPGLDEKDLIRNLVVNDACTDCRLTTGNQIQTWVFVSYGGVVDALTGAILDLASEENRPKGLKQYESSEGTFRESCGTCGATILWWSTKKMRGAEKLDISAGLIDETVAGSRAEGWLHWYEKVLYANDSLNDGAVSALVEGINANNEALAFKPFFLALK